ncbi:hypothetical protein [Halorubrum ezzemoulense]|jgi:hypothetical protein|uniref:hypothetical protein n=1 Tax=Halorubrum ezzemoulense TaxID=337243 RepID=UPI00232ADE10|nr:hypothetical protein [Halorubrum ezzemoulense]MDB2249812.1 hypothetical protein [Halorubrum ezzemoulense]MDB2253319.1 hypothetical protein [Halorubrum ezzemoulense]MDB2283588.1 hypothetical protein [Halorubrum ezzemoulense]MDB2286782.1 hypothetical protein [Halorubrum ezzemoulense]
MSTPRRNVLAAAVTGSTLGLAGCGNLAGSDGNITEQTDGEEGGTEDDNRASATIALDVQEEIQQAQEEIGTRVQEENLSRENAQAEFRDAQIEIISAAIEDVRTYAADTEGLAVQNTNEQLGAVLVSGPAAAVLGTLDTDPVNSLLSASDFPAPQEDGQPNGS